MSMNERGSNIKNIRTYIMGLIYRNGFSSVRVPSSMELAERFEVTRRTARMALEGLIDEGWLIGRSGVGTFTNPTKGFKVGDTPQNPLVGLCLNNGSHFYYDLFSGLIFSECMRSLLNAGCNVYPAIHVPNDPESLSRELENAGVDAMLFCYPEEGIDTIKSFAATHRPCITIKNSVEGCDFVHFDYKKVFQSLAEQSRRDGCRRLTVFKSIGPVYDYFDDLTDSFAAIAPEVRFEIIDVTPITYEEQLDRVFSRENAELPDLALISWRAPLAAQQALERHHIAPDRCKLIADGDIISPENWRGGFYTVPKNKAAEAAANLLAYRLSHRDLPPLTISVEGILCNNNPLSKGD